LLGNMFRGVSTVITLNVTSKLLLPLYLMTVPRLRDGTVCKNRDKPIKYTVRVIRSCQDVTCFLTVCPFKLDEVD
jgi:hypothetical protein